MKFFILSISGFILPLLFILLPAHAVQKYNAFTNKWETTSKDSEMKYNAFDNEWSYEQPGSQLEYNAFENEWEYAPPDCENSD